MLFTDEVKTMDELIVKLGSVAPELDTIKVAVVCFLFDKAGKLVLQRRGPGARDEIGKLEAIGGSVNNKDANLREALRRELIEEAGDKAEIVIEDFIGAQIDGKIDAHTKQYTNWIILAYKGLLVDGELINAEPDRSIGFERNSLEEFLGNDLSKTAENFVRYLLEEN